MDLGELGDAQKPGENARQVLGNAKRFYEGYWLYIKVSSKQDVFDVQQLIALKAKPRPGREKTRSAPPVA